jgi:hypothetical protein
VSNGRESGGIFELQTTGSASTLFRPIKEEFWPEQQKPILPPSFGFWCGKMRPPAVENLRGASYRALSWRSPELTAGEWEKQDWQFS